MNLIPTRRGGNFCGKIILFITNGLKNEKRVVILATVFAILMFFINYSLELKLYSLSVFDQYDVLFDTNPNEGLNEIANGYGRRILVHPNFSNFFSIPIRIISKETYFLSIGNSSQFDLRRSMALVLTPLCSSIKIFFIFITFYIIGFSLLRTSLITLLSLLSFSQLIFGSIPEHFAFSSLCIVLLYFVTIVFIKKGRIIFYWPWIILGIIITGITISNIFIFFLFLLSTVYYFNKKLPNAIFSSAIISLLCITINLSLFFIANKLYGQPCRLHVRIGNYINENPIKKLINSPTDLANTITPPRFKVTESETGIGHDNKFKMMFTLEDVPGISSIRNLLGFIITLLLICGSVMHCFNSDLSKRLAFISMVIIFYNLVFHAIWGDEYFLYSQHWYFSIIFLISGFLLMNKRVMYITDSLFIILIIFVSVNNFIIIKKILSILALNLLMP